MKLDHILQWKLLSGSHGFPGPDGGTCINEAAIVAAGFPYKAVSTAADCPPCFSPVLSAYLIRLNDGMSDRERQRLLPFVMRLSGSRDTDATEIERARFIAVETVRRMLPAALKAHFPEHATACAAVEVGSTKEHAAEAAEAAAEANAYAAAEAANADADTAYDAANAAANAAAYAADAANAATYAAEAAEAAAYTAYAAEAAANAAEAGKAAAYAAEAADAAAYTAYDAVWTISIEIAEGALAIGKQAEPLDTALIVERMERAKVEAVHA